MSVDIQFLSKSRISGAGTTEMRCVQPAQYLAEGGWRTGYGCIYRSLPGARKAIVFHRTALDPHTAHYLKYAKACGLVTIYDTDDLLFDEGVEPEHVSSPEAFKAYRDMMAQCDVVLVSTRYLQQRAATFHSDVRVMKNGLSKTFVAQADTVYNLKKQHKQPPYVTIAYLSGSKYHDDDFRLVEPALVNILQDFPETRLLLMGKLQYSERFREFGERFQYRNFVPYQDFGQVFQEININIAPLNTQKPFEQARSEIKYTEAGIFGIPTIASPTETYCEAITDGMNGLLAEDGDWYDTLRLLTANPRKRHTLGEAARHDVLNNDGPEKRASEWNELMGNILERYQHATASNYLHARITYFNVLRYWVWRWMKISTRTLLEK